MGNNEELEGVGIEARYLRGSEVIAIKISH